MTAASRSAEPAGFTLIELLVVMSILGLLAAALTPAISRALSRGDDAETNARMLRIKTAAESFADEFGTFPPDNFEPFGGEDYLANFKATSDRVNAGIESFVLFVSWTAKSGFDLTEHEDWLANTDGDNNEAQIPMLDRTAKVEIVDSWRTPFAYFVRPTTKSTQEIMLENGEILTARPHKNPKTGKCLGARNFQIVSAGPDLMFNTDDDLVYPPKPLEDE